jgi:predicted secreted protein
LEADSSARREATRGGSLPGPCLALKARKTLRRGVLPGLLLIAILAGCGQDEPADGPTSPSTTIEVTTTKHEETTTTGPISMDPAPRLFTQETPTGSYVMAIGQTAALRLVPGTPPPVVEGTSVLVLEVAFLTDPGYREWELRAVEVGETSIQLGDGSGPAFRLVVRN